MRDTSGVSVDVTRFSKSGSGNTAAECVASGEAAHMATARRVAHDEAYLSNFRSVFINSFFMIFRY